MDVHLEFFHRNASRIVMRKCSGTLGLRKGSRSMERRICVTATAKEHA